MKKVRLAAHRGFSKYYPENTMLAFKEALKLDIDMIETDVHMTRDGELVLGAVGFTCNDAKLAGEILKKLGAR